MISGSTRIAGIIGDPVNRSLSPVMHNAAYASDGLDWAYLAFTVEPRFLKAAADAARALNLAGLNVTMPHKAPVIDFLDEISPEAQAIGSVNTIVNNKGHLKGYNTDIEGFKRALSDTGYDASGKTALIVGAGGAARAVARALSEAGAAGVSVACRDKNSAERLLEVAAVFGVPGSSYPIDATAAEAIGGADIVVNATPLGKESITDIKFLVDGLKPSVFVADLSTVPPLSAYLVAAQERGCKVMGGLGMLVHQGSLSYELWTGKQAPLQVMKEAVGAGR